MQAVVRQGEADGVFGVPFFVLEQEGKTRPYWGNDRIEYVLKDIQGTVTLPAMPADSLTSLRA